MRSRSHIILHPTQNQIPTSLGVHSIPWSSDRSSDRSQFGFFQVCSSARKSRNFSVKRRLWEISTSVRTSVHAFDVILVMKVPYIGQKMFACSFRVGQPALPVRPVPLQVSMPTRMCMVGRWTWSSSLVLGPQWASRLALAATRAAVLPP